MSRSSKNPDKIKYVSLVNGRWVYRPYIPLSRHHEFPTVDTRGFLRPIKLGVEGDPWSKILKAHAKVQEDLEGHVERDKFTLRWVVLQYEASSEYKRLSKGSHDKHKTLRRILDHEIQINHRPATLGDLFIDEIKKPYVRQIREKRLADLQERGHSGFSQCNREITFLSTAVGWAQEMYEEITVNPFKGIKKLKENERDRYVTDAEYFKQLKIAAEIADYLPVFMELTYLCAARGIEVTELEIADTKAKSDGSEQTIKVARKKGSKTTYIKRNDRVDAAIDAAMKLHRSRKISGKYLLPGLRGPKLVKSTVDSAMQRLKKRMAELKLKSNWRTPDGVAEEESDLFWTLHDLKRKGVSDSDNKDIAGHKSEAMKARYNVKAEIFEAPGS